MGQPKTHKAAKITAPGYQKLVVDEVDTESNAEILEEVHAILDDESCQQDDPEDSECLSGRRGIMTKTQTQSSQQIDKRLLTSHLL